MGKNSERVWGRGKLVPHGTGYSWRVRLLGTERKSFRLRPGITRKEAEERQAVLVDAKERLRAAGTDLDLVTRILTDAAKADAVRLKLVLQIVDEQCEGVLVKNTNRPYGPTFRDVANRWTSGDLARQFPDDVRDKDSTRDAQRLAKIVEIEVRGMPFGDLPVERITLNDCREVMSQLPQGLRPATRRAYGQAMSKVLSYSVEPLQLRQSSPIPSKWLPKVGKPPAFTYLRPKEDARLLACSEVPLSQRILFGFLAREGCRVGEAAALRWRDLDLEVGTLVLEDSKTGESRTWALGADVVAALETWRGLTLTPEPNEPVFTDEHGRPVAEDGQAELLRAALLRAGVDRHQLHNSGPKRSRLRAHDLRAGFATLALASGRNEAWVCARTGWTSSAMVARYKRRAEGEADLDLGWYHPLDRTIPELAQAADVHETPAPTAENGQQNGQQIAKAPWRNGRRRGFKKPCGNVSNIKNLRETAVSEDPQAAEVDQTPPVDRSADRSRARSHDPREALAAALSAALTSGDTHAARVAHEALGKLLDGAGGEPATVTDLATERRRRGK